MLHENDIHTEVLIIGAGPAGSSAALFLSKFNIPCVLADKATFPRDKICGDALSGKVMELLRKLDPVLATELGEDENAIGSYGVIFGAPNRATLRVPFKKDVNALKQAPGLVSKRLYFDNFLFERAKKKTNILCLENTELRKFSYENDAWKVVTQEGTQIKSKLILAADGEHSEFAKQFGSISHQLEDKCFGLRAYFKNVKGLDEQNFIELHFFERLLPGYFWIFPLPNGDANIGLGIRSDYVQKHKVSLPKLFKELLETEPMLQERFSDAEQVGSVKLCGLPLGSKKWSVSGHAFMLLGDAASLIDPFTGEGIGNAMFSGMYAAEQVKKCLQEQNVSASFMSQYDEVLFHRLWPELQLGKRMQELVRFPWLFNFVVRKANKNKQLKELIMSMFEDIDLRNKLKKPSFYLNLIFK